MSKEHPGRQKKQKPKEKTIDYCFENNCKLSDKEILADLKRLVGPFSIEQARDAIDTVRYIESKRGKIPLRSNDDPGETHYHRTWLNIKDLDFIIYSGERKYALPMRGFEGIDLFSAAHLHDILENTSHSLAQLCENMIELKKKKGDLVFNRVLNLSNVYDIMKNYLFDKLKKNTARKPSKKPDYVLQRINPIIDDIRSEFFANEEIKKDKDINELIEGYISNFKELVIDEIIKFNPALTMEDISNKGINSGLGERLKNKCYATYVSKHIKDENVAELLIKAGDLKHNLMTIDFLDFGRQNRLLRTKHMILFDHFRKIIHSNKKHEVYNLTLMKLVYESMDEAHRQYSLNQEKIEGKIKVKGKKVKVTEKEKELFYKDKKRFENRHIGYTRGLYKRYIKVLLKLSGDSNDSYRPDQTNHYKKLLSQEVDLQIKNTDREDNPEQYKEINNRRNIELYNSIMNYRQASPGILPPELRTRLHQLRKRIQFPH